MTMYALNPRSNNKKVGKIAVSTTSADSCPPDCPLRDAACYAATGPLSWYWRKIGNGQGMTLGAFIDALHKLPDGAKFRHNQAGDLPGFEGTLDNEACTAIAAATAHLDGWTYTHYRPTAHNLRTLREMQEAGGLLVNLSADDMSEADKLAATGFPVCVTVPEDHPEKSTTPNGLPVVVCPVQTDKAKDCDTCMLCARERNVVVAFRAHGARKGMIK